jgi:hypothetical protein
MKKPLLFIMMVIFMASCNPGKWCAKHAPIQESRKDSSTTKTEIKYRDTIIPIYIPGEHKTDTLYLENKSLSEILKYAQANPKKSVMGLFNSDTSRLETGLAISWAWIAKGILWHELTQKDTTIQKRLENAIKETTIYHDRYVEVQKKYLERERFWWGWIKKIFWIMVVIALIIVIVKFGWKYIKRI